MKKLVWLCPFILVACQSQSEDCYNLYRDATNDSSDSTVIGQALDNVYIPCMEELR